MSFFFTGSLRDEVRNNKAIQRYGLLRCSHDVNDVFSVSLF